MPTTWKPAYLGDAERRSFIRFTTPKMRMVDGEPRVVFDGGQPVMLTIEGEIVHYVRRNDHRPHPIIEYRVAGIDRTFTSRPDFHIEILAV